jgi:hypothetical protein
MLFRDRVNSVRFPVGQGSATRRGVAAVAAGSGNRAIVTGFLTGIAPFPPRDWRPMLLSSRWLRSIGINLPTEITPLISTIKLRSKTLYQGRPKEICERSKSV